MGLGWAIPVGLGLANMAFGKKGESQAEVPKDLKPMREQQIALLNYFLGMGPSPWSPGSNPRAQQYAGLPPGAQSILGRLGVDGNSFQQPLAHQPGMTPQGGATPATGQSNLAQVLPFLQQQGIQQATLGFANGGTVAFRSGAGKGQGKGKGYEGGGMVRGPGGPKDDKISAKLSNGEGVLTAETVNAIGGPSAIDFLNMLGMLTAGGGGMGMGQGMGQEPQTHFATGGVAGMPFLAGLPPEILQQIQGLGGQPAPTPTPAPGPAPTAPKSPTPSVFPKSLTPAPTIPTGGALTSPNSPNIGADTTLTKAPGQQRLESFFGPLGTPVTNLQRQSVGGMEQFLNANPYGQAQSALDQILGNNPGQGMLDALRPHFERNLAAANQTGGRFGSANAILRSRAVDDYNLLAAQALQQGVQQQMQAADLTRMLGGQRINDLTSGYNMGGAFGQQLNSGQQQAIQLLLNQLQTAQSAAFGVPTAQQPGWGQQFLGGAMAGASILPFLQGGGGGQSQGYINPNGWTTYTGFSK